jgi:hypothetical protein
MSNGGFVEAFLSVDDVDDGMLDEDDIEASSKEDNEDIKDIKDIKEAELKNDQDEIENDDNDNDQGSVKIDAGVEIVAGVVEDVAAVGPQSDGGRKLSMRGDGRKLSTRDEISRCCDEDQLT